MFILVLKIDDQKSKYVTCRFGDGLLKADANEYFNSIVCGFHTIKCWYNCNSKNNSY